MADFGWNHHISIDSTPSGNGQSKISSQVPNVSNPVSKRSVPLWIGKEIQAMLWGFAALITIPALLAD
jgi:hypothetical protein